MKVLILGLNYCPEPVGVAVYTTGLVRHLAAQGHDVTAVAGIPYYPRWQVFPGVSLWGHGPRVEDGVSVQRVPHYVPKCPTGLRRLLHHASFAGAALIPLLLAALRQRPDLVIAVAPSLMSAPVALLVARLFGARTWLHVQDFEVEAAKATGLLRATGPIARLAPRLERALLTGFDRVSAISSQMCRKLIEKGRTSANTILFRNWADPAVTPGSDQSSPLRAEWSITTPHVALYSGNIANKQGIEIVVDAARALSHRNDLTFVICGAGPNRARLEHLCADLPNVCFHDLQPVERLNDLMQLASVHLLPQRDCAADLVLPSKLTNMLASGRPVVATARQGTGLHEEVSGCGLVIDPGDAVAFATAITTLLDDPATAAALGKAACARAQERWNMAHTLGEIEQQMLALVALPRHDAKRPRRRAPA